MRSINIIELPKEYNSSFVKINLPKYGYLYYCKNENCHVKEIIYNREKTLYLYEVTKLNLEKSLLFFEQECKNKGAKLINVPTLIKHEKNGVV